MHHGRNKAGRPRRRGECGRAARVGQGYGMGRGVCGRRSSGPVKPDASFRSISPVTSSLPVDRRGVIPLPPADRSWQHNTVPETVDRSMPAAPRPRRTATIRPERECTGCGLCAEVCPLDAITMEGIALVDPMKCVGCGLCVSQCPDEVLALAAFQPTEHSATVLEKG